MGKGIAFAGTRGLPANYGGFETAVDEITRRFVETGYACDVFCRISHSGAGPSELEGRNLIYVKGAKNPRLETFVSAFQTGSYLFKHRREYAHVFWFNNANFPGVLLTLLAGIPVTVNTDGLEWRRKKWSAPFKAYHFIAAWLISRIVPRLISDSRGIQEYYRKVFRRDTIMISYGAPAPVEVSRAKQAEILRRYDLEPTKYFLQITRFEPDNLPLEVAQGFLESRLAEQGLCYVAVGFRIRTPYELKLKKLSEQGGVVRVFPAVYDPDVLFSLRSNCFAYVHGNSVGGTNPALLEALVTCPRILAIDVPFNREVLREAGMYFTQGNIPHVIREALNSPIQRHVFTQQATRYNWDNIVRAYMEIARGTNNANSSFGGPPPSF